MGEIETKERVRREVTIRIALRRQFDFDHARAEIGQQRRRIRAGNKGRTFDDGDIFEHTKRHGSIPRG